MDAKDREELAAAFAGMHNLFALLVRRGATEGSIDISELLIDLDSLLEQPGQHPRTLAVENDARELLLGLLGSGPHGSPVAIRQNELLSVAPARQSPGFHPESGDDSSPPG